jgi:hypothetical protein
VLDVTGRDRTCGAVTRNLTYPAEVQASYSCCIQLALAVLFVLHTFAASKEKRGPPVAQSPGISHILQKPKMWSMRYAWKYCDRCPSRDFHLHANKNGKQKKSTTGSTAQDKWSFARHWRKACGGTHGSTATGAPATPSTYTQTSTQRCTQRKASTQLLIARHRNTATGAPDTPST